MAQQITKEIDGQDYSAEKIKTCCNDGKIECGGVYLMGRDRGCVDVDSRRDSDQLDESVSGNSIPLLINSQSQLLNTKAR